MKQVKVISGEHDSIKINDTVNRFLATVGNPSIEIVYYQDCERFNFNQTVITMISYIITYEV